MESPISCPRELVGLIPHPAKDDNKYSRGILHLVGGSADYPGAAALAAVAAQRMGAGYVQVWSSPSSVHDVRSGHPSLVVRPWEKSVLQQALLRDSQRQAALLVGPGFGSDHEEEARLLELALAAALPLVVDGGALGHLAAAQAKGALEDLRSRGAHPLVLTPHGGEARSLCQGAGLSAESQKATAQQLAQAYGAVVVLKGPETIICAGERLQVMNQGGPELAKAGTGDVLAGMIGALLAQGLDAFDAAVLGSWLHALAGRSAAARYTDVSVIPEDLIQALPTAIAQVEQG